MRWDPIEPGKARICRKALSLTEFPLSLSVSLSFVGELSHARTQHSWQRNVKNVWQELHDEEEAEKD